MAADGMDVIQIDVAAVDSEGRVVPTAMNQIRFDATGPATILGVGNGDPSSHAPNRGPTRALFNGFACVLIRSTQTTGEAVVTASYWAANAAYDCPYFGNARGFETFYNKNFQRPLAYHMASGAACVLAYAEAMKAAGGPDPAKVRDALSAMDFPCFYGRVKFTEQGDGDPQLMGPLVAQVQKGVLEIVHPQAAASATAIWPAPAWSARG